MNDRDRGYSVTEGVFSHSRRAELSGALAGLALYRTRAGARQLLRVPPVRTLAAEPALLNLAETFLGARPIPFRATLFDKTAASNWLVAWHQDTVLPVQQRVDDQSWGPWTLKGGVLHANAPSQALEQIVALRVHLDDSAASNGPLRVLPGTHARGILGRDEIQRLADAVPPVNCVVTAGGVVSMRPLLVHSSSKSVDDRPRRVIHIEYAASVQIDPRVELAIC